MKETVIRPELYPDFNFQMGKACRDIGFHDRAIEQPEIALERGQKPALTARALGMCYREKGWFHKAQKCHEKAFEMESNTQGGNPRIKRELGMV